MLHTPFYDPEKSYEENFTEGPFGVFKDGEVIPETYEPKFEFFGYKVRAPFGIPAGPLLNGRFCKAAMEQGFDIVTYKTVRSRKYPSHPWPNVLAAKIDGDLPITQDRLVADTNYKEPISITNSFGVPSMDPEFWMSDLAKVVKEAPFGQIVVGSFQGTKEEGQNAEEYINDYRVAATMLKDTLVKVIEVNLSCPNEGSNNLLCFDTLRSALVVKAIKEIIGETPLIIKIAYYKDEEALKNFVKEIGGLVEGISAINGMNTEVVKEDGTPALPGEGRLRSGICGHAIKWAGLDMVAKLKKIREELGLKYKIIGVGGVTNVNDFFEYREAGADYVMSATGAMWNPYLAKEIKERLYLKQ